MSQTIPMKDSSGTTQNARVINNGTDIVPQHGRTPQPAATGNTNNPGTNAAAVITLAAPGAGIFNVIAGVYWSYGAAPTGGNLQITDNAGLFFEVDITAAGPGFMPFDPPIRNAAANHPMVITLAAGGSAIQGRINVNSWTE